MSGSVSTRVKLTPSGATSSSFARLVVAISLGSVLCATAPRLCAQSADSQRDSQDVAEAARQTRAGKQHTTGHHVYTNEDLRRKKILTADDQARSAAAKQNLQPLPGVALPPTRSLDANSVAPQEPLGDVARRYRDAKKVSPFHLPANRPEFATPKILAPDPEMRPMPALRPQPPAKNFDPSKPSLPLSRNASPNAPVLPAARGHRIDPFVGRRSARPLAPVVPSVGSSGPSVVAAPNAALGPVRRSSSSESQRRIVVQPGDTLWALSRQHLGRGTRWLELMAANPNLPDATRLVPGTTLTLPLKTSSSHRTTAAHTITVHEGDSLSKLALAAYGHASYWPCVARANSSLVNPNRLHIGQAIALPASCTP